jgi:Rieske Fe-S protein
VTALWAVAFFGLAIAGFIGVRWIQDRARPCTYLGKLVDYANNTVVKIDCVPAFVVRSDDNMIVYLGLSTHMPNEPLEWDADERLFVSPFHGESFDIWGDVVTGPANGPLIECDVELRDGELWLDAARDANPSEIAQMCRAFTLEQEKLNSDGSAQPRTRSRIRAAQ